MQNSRQIRAGPQFVAVQCMPSASPKMGCVRHWLHERSSFDDFAFHLGHISFAKKILKLTMFGPGRFGDVILKRRKPHKLSVAKCRRAVVHSTQGKRPRHQPPEMKRPITFYKKYCVYRGRYSKTTLIFNKMGFEGETTANFQTLNPT